MVDALRHSVFSSLGEFPWIEKINAVFLLDEASEETHGGTANKNVTKLSCLRIILQMLRNNKELSQLQAQAGLVMAMANEAIKDKVGDSILIATGLLLISAMAKQYGSIKKELIDQYVDVKLIIDLFEKSATVSKSETIKNRKMR